MFTPEMLQEFQNTLKCVIQVIFQDEERFKEEVLGGKRCVGWDSNTYRIERCHAAMHYRISLIRDDGRKKDIYADAKDVLVWFLKLQDEVLNKEKGV